MVRLSDDGGGFEIGVDGMVKVAFSLEGVAPVAVSPALNDPAKVRPARWPSEPADSDVWNARFDTPKEPPGVTVAIEPVTVALKLVVPSTGKPVHVAVKLGVSAPATLLDATSPANPTEPTRPAAARATAPPSDPMRTDNLRVALM